jgi:hypothetical protein
MVYHISDSFIGCPISGCPISGSLFCLSINESGNLLNYFIPYPKNLISNYPHLAFCDSFEDTDIWFPQIYPQNWRVIEKGEPFTDEKSDLSYFYETLEVVDN